MLATGFAEWRFDRPLHWLDLPTLACFLTSAYLRATPIDGQPAVLDQPREPVNQVSAHLAQNVIIAATASEDAADSMLKFGMRAQSSGPAAFGAAFQADLKCWAPIVKASGFTAEE